MNGVVALALLVASPFVGSFLATAARRLPEDAAGLLTGRSRCDGCGMGLSAAELVPIASWLLLRGRCRHCGAAVGVDHPAIEAGAVCVALAALWLDPDRAVATAILGWWLLLLAAIDLRTGLLPDLLTVPLVAAGLIEALAADDILLDRAIGAAAGYLVFAGANLAYRRIRGRDGLGLGDAKLLAAGGAWLGWAALPNVVLAAAIGALCLVIVRDRSRLSATTAIAFGPWLAAAIWIARFV